MDFFKQLFAQFPDANIRMTIMGKNGKYTVSVVPGTKENNIRPITATGTPTDLDNELLAQLRVPLTEAGTTLKNIDAMQADIKALEDETKKKADDKKKAAASKNKATEKKPDEKAKKDDKPAEKQEERKSSQPANSLF